MHNFKEYYFFLQELDLIHETIFFESQLAMMSRYLIGTKSWYVVCSPIFIFSKWVCSFL